MSLELWINQKDKIISFHPILDWLHEKYESKEKIREQVERFIDMGFRFQ